MPEQHFNLLLFSNPGDKVSEDLDSASNSQTDGQTDRGFFWCTNKAHVTNKYLEYDRNSLPNRFTTNKARSEN